MNLSLNGRKALVCGSSQGIGAAIAIALAEEGVKVVLVARNAVKLEKLSQSLKGEGHTSFSADLLDKHHVDRLAAFVERQEIDIVVNNTGGPPPGLLTEASLSDFNQALQMHLYASHTIMQKALPYMKQAGFGRFINVISTSVKIPISGLGVSNTTRGAMASWSKTLSNEVAQYGITVNNILPGAVDTSRLSAIISGKAKNAAITQESAAEQMKREIPAGRFGQPEELGALAAFLASEKAAYINGVSIPVDGGRTGTL